MIQSPPHEPARSRRREEAETPLADQVRLLTAAATVQGFNAPNFLSTNSLLTDSYGRVMRDLRVSVTDRCNFRCLYCLPETEAALNFYRGRWANLPNPTPIARQWTSHEKILSFEEIERLVRIAADLGIQKIRLTGGEPLLRQQIEILVGKIARIPGITDLAMTTNGFLFPKKAKALRDAGLKRISFSMDSLDRENFKKITGRDGLNEVLQSIELAQQLGLNPVKVNAVIIRGINDHEIETLAEFAREKNLGLRFIEFMPLDSGRAWQKELVVSAKEILQRLETHFSRSADSLSASSRDPFQNADKLSALLRIKSQNKSETAKRWTFADGRGEIGIIAPVSEPFCGNCNRIRLMADGKIRTCLFSAGEHDFRSLLRDGSDDEAIQNELRNVVWKKEDRHHIGEPEFVQPQRSMSCIGG